MNRRNAEYIMRWNPRSAFPIVDDKLLTKQLATEWGIPTPKLHHVIEVSRQVSRLNDILDGLGEFAVKPSRGAGGSGIILVTRRTHEAFTTTSGNILFREELAYHVSDILSGIHSLAGLEDRALIEALIHPDCVFDHVSYRGVPDIRIIVYRGVPAMGMVRLPTRASDGKANLHRGAIGAGIDIGTGETSTAVHRSRIITHHPDTGNPLPGIAVPFWETMLLIAARSFEMTRLGYLGVDLAIDQELGPLLLELNARPGLAIQLANRAGLLERLRGIDEAPAEILRSPEARVTWAQEKFRV